MGIIKRIKKLTNSIFLNLYELERENATGPLGNYYMSSRAKEIENLKISTKQVTPDGVIIYSVFEDKVVLIRQYRYPVDGYVYEFPAGLVDPGEDLVTAGVREFKEETGMELELIPAHEAYTRPYFMSVGMTDEACGMIYGYASGTITKKYQELSEEIEVVLVDREEAKRILKEENMALVCSYMLMHFISSEEPFSFLDTIK